jgi:hypothetical protein
MNIGDTVSVAFAGTVSTIYNSECIIDLKYNDELIGQVRVPFGCTIPTEIRVIKTVRPSWTEHKDAMCITRDSMHTHRVWHRPDDNDTWYLVGNSTPHSYNSMCSYGTPERLVLST